MKKLLLIFVILCSRNALQAQCDSPQSQIDLHVNNIKARILNGGDLFTDHIDGQFLPNPNPDLPLSPATIYAAGLWMGGVDPDGDLKVATVDYRNNNGYGSDYSAGPLSVNGQTNATTCQNWDRLFRVTGDEIAAFLEAQPLMEAQAIAQFPSVMGWPGTMNATFADIWGFDLPAQHLAPYYDVNLDGIYNPLEGDYPVVQLQNHSSFVPAEIIWCVFNDQNGGALHSNSYGQALQVEIQLTTWAFNCTDQPLLNNTIFTSHKIINRGTEAVDSTFIGLWVDFMLGCHFDDYVGCNPALNTFFVYNQDAVDGQPGAFCQGVTTFSDTPPVQTVTFLNKPISKFTYYRNYVEWFSAIKAPTYADGFYRYLTGSWNDGSPLIYGGSGYGTGTQTDFAFPSDPADPNGWSMCSANFGIDDFRVVASTKIDQLLPRQVEELTAAWSVHYNPPLPCNLGSVMDDVALLHTLFDTDFNGVCSSISKASGLHADSLDLLPNPTTGDVTLWYGSIRIEEIRIFDATGKHLQTLKNLEKEQTTLNLRKFPAGIYTLRLFTDQGNVTKKLAVAR